MFAIQRLVKYISIQETHYIVPLIRSSPIENKLQCVVLLRLQIAFHRRYKNQLKSNVSCMMKHTILYL